MWWFVPYVVWHVLVAASNVHNFYGFGDPAEGCHWRAQERCRFCAFVPVKRTDTVLCWHYATELEQRP